MSYQMLNVYVASSMISIWKLENIGLQIQNLIKCYQKQRWNVKKKMDSMNIAKNFGPTTHHFQLLSNVLYFPNTIRYHYKNLFISFYNVIIDLKFSVFLCYLISSLCSKRAIFVRGIGGVKTVPWCLWARLTGGIKNRVGSRLFQLYV
jgi:hypothetical protein